MYITSQIKVMYSTMCHTDETHNKAMGLYIFRLKLPKTFPCLET